MNTISKQAWLILALFMVVFRFGMMFDQELAWDVFGYYMPLPATFIYDDPFLNSTSWVEGLNANYQLSDTLYQISSTPDGNPMYFFFLGMAILFLPFFLLGHALALFLGVSADGFTWPYQYAMVSGALVYTLIGLWYFRKFLLFYFSEKWTALLLFLLVFGTNFIHHGIQKSLETVAMLWLGSSLIFYYSYQIHQSFQRNYAVIICLVLAMMVMIKPSEIFFALVPILWGVNNLETLKARAQLFWENRKTLLFAFVPALLLLSIQIGYFLLKTGQPFYDSYKNPGVGLDWKNPHIIESLFGYRKGWFVYTPIMILIIYGWIRVYKEKRQHFLGWFSPFVLSAYLVFSWTEYWYGAAYSNRPLIAWFPLLFLVLGFALVHLFKQNIKVKIVTAAFIISCVTLNCFQYWQFQKGIIDPYRTTKEYYWATFLQTKMKPEWEDLKLIKRSFKPEAVKIPANYKIVATDFKQNENFVSTQEFVSTLKKKFNTLTEKDHLYVQSVGNFESKDTTGIVYLTILIEGESGAYSFQYFPLKGRQARIEATYLTPELRSKSDKICVYFWNPNKIEFQVSDWQLSCYEKKDIRR